MWYWHDGLSWWGWFGMTVSTVIFWGLVIWGIVALMRSFNSPETRRSSVDQQVRSPESILAERFARGEIDEQEFTHKREVLHSTSPSSDRGTGNEAPSERDIEPAVR